MEVPENNWSLEKQRDDNNARSMKRLRTTLHAWSCSVEGPALRRGRSYLSRFVRFQTRS